MKIRSIWDQLTGNRAAEQLRYALGKSSLGHVLVALSDKGVVLISVSDSRDELLAELETRFPSAEIEPGHREEKAALGTVLAFIEDPAQPLDLTLDMRGTAFQKRVWEAVRTIPVGQTRTYADIAKKIGAPQGHARGRHRLCQMRLLFCRSLSPCPAQRWHLRRQHGLERRPSEPSHQT